MSQKSTRSWREGALREAAYPRNRCHQEQSQVSILSVPQVIVLGPGQNRARTRGCALARLPCQGKAASNDNAATGTRLMPLRFERAGAAGGAGLNGCGRKAEGRQLEPTQVKLGGRGSAKPADIGPLGCPERPGPAPWGSSGAGRPRRYRYHESSSSHGVAGPILNAAEDQGRWAQLSLAFVLGSSSAGRRLWAMGDAHSLQGMAGGEESHLP
jgi:hypothetical protein